MLLTARTVPSRVSNDTLRSRTVSNAMCSRPPSGGYHSGIAHRAPCADRLSNPAGAPIHVIQRDGRGGSEGSGGVSTDGGARVPAEHAEEDRGRARYSLADLRSR